MAFTPIHPDTRIASVALNVSDTAGVAAFYRDRVGLRDPRLVRLIDRPGSTRPGRATGLFHVAILVPTRADLAATLRRLIDTGTRLDGASDHLVSEALYLSDPEGNGIEIYRDRPRSEWVREGGMIRMTTEPLDLDSLLAEAPSASAELPPGTTIGHIHLRVAAIAPAEAFYRHVLGFDLTLRYGHAASFLSAGGYHHHIAVNTWSSSSALPPPDGSTGLAEFSIYTPNVEAPATRLAGAGIAHDRDGDDVLVSDPSHNRIRLTATIGTWPN